MTPVEAVLGLFSTAFDAVFGWFVRVLMSSGAAGLYLAVFTIYCVVRFLLVPIIGNAFNFDDEVGED